MRFVFKQELCTTRLDCRIYAAKYIRLIFSLSRQIDKHARHVMHTSDIVRTMQKANDATCSGSPALSRLDK